MARRKQTTPTKNKRQKSKRKATPMGQPSIMKRLMKSLLTLGLVFGLLGILGFFGAYLYFARDLPDHRNYEFIQTSRIYSADGIVIRELFQTDPTVRRTVVPIVELPSVVIDAILAAEDANFYDHEGLDYLGIVRALYKMVTRGKISGGGSTITQQTVKNMLLKPERKFKRKFKELILAKRLESTLTKDEILHIYLNIIYFGHGRNGIEEAAQYYFGIPAKHLNLRQSATIAGLIQSPEKHSPRKAPESAKARQVYVLNQMVRKGFLGKAQAQKAIEAPLPKLGKLPSSYTEYRWFTDQVIKKLESRYDLRTLQTGGFRIDTTLDSKWQLTAERAVRNKLDQAVRQRLPRKKRRVKLKKWVSKRRKQLGKKAVPIGVSVPSVVVSKKEGVATLSLGKGEGVLPAAHVRRWERILKRSLKLGDKINVIVEKPPRGGEPGRLRLASLPEAAMAVIDPTSGNVKALVGGYDWRISKFNRSVQMKRQIGSTFKPFIYAAALQSRNYTLATTLIDSPETIALGGGKYYQPRNYTNRYVGEVSLRHAMAKSINTTAIRTALDLKRNKVVEIAQRCGLEGPYPRGPSLALGAIETSPLVLAKSFTPFANEGLQVTPRLITQVSQNGESIEKFEQSSRTVLSAGVAYLMREALVEVVQNGTATTLRNLPQTVGGKTGTTNGNRDAWFVGITPSLVAAVWVGRDNNQRVWPRATGGTAAAPIFKQFMKNIKPVGLVFPPRPESIVELEIDTNGFQINEGDTSERKEFFLVGTEPKFAPKELPSLDSIWDEMELDEPDEAAPVEAENSQDPQSSADLDERQESENPPTLKLFDKAPSDDKESTPKTEKEPTSKTKLPDEQGKQSKKKKRSLFEEDLFE